MTDPHENACLLQENRLYTSELTRKAMKAPESLEANEVVFLAECFERSMVVVEESASKDAEIERLRGLIRTGIENAGIMRGARLSLWSIVGALFGLGSTSATALCREFGFDPDRPGR